jgi:hypothetical protein
LFCASENTYIIIIRYFPMRFKENIKHILKEVRLVLTILPPPHVLIALNAIYKKLT